MLPQFENCKGNIKGTRLLEFQFNRQPDKEQEIWYKVKDDFNATAWEKTFSINTTDTQGEGSKRTTKDVDTFEEAFEVTMTDTNTSPFLQALFDCTLQGDDYFTDLLDHGLNARTTIVFPDGATVRKTYPCMTVTDLAGLIEQLNTPDSEASFTVNVNYPPTVENTGFSTPLPTKFTEVSIDGLMVTEADPSVDVIATAVTDVDGLIYTDPVQWKVDIFNPDTLEFLGSETGNIVTGISVNLGAITYPFLAVVSYLYFIDGNNTRFYRAIAEQRVDL